MLALNILMLIPILCILMCVICNWNSLSKYITFVGAFFIFIIALYYTRKITQIHPFIGYKDAWIGIDGFGAVILLLVAFVNLCASIFSIGYMDIHKKRLIKRYYFNYNLFVFSMLIVPIIQEPNVVWVAVELTTLFSVILVGFENSHEALEAAWKYVVITLMGAGIALLGFLILFAAAKRAGIEHYTWTSIKSIAPHMSPTLVKASLFLILVGFGTKVGLVPLHTWLPDAHSQAPSPVCALLSGIETSVVLYVILKLFPIVRHVPGLDISKWIMIFGLISTGVAAFLIIQVRDYKRLFAFSTVEHMGIILVAFSMFSHSGNISGILQIIAHAITKSTCFYSAGLVLFLYKTRDINFVRSIIKDSPFAGFILFISALAISGAPPVVVFFSEFSIVKSGIYSGHYIMVSFLVFFIIIAFFAIMNHISRMVFSKKNAKSTSISMQKIPISMKIGLLLSILPVIIFGIYPVWIYKIAKIAAISLGG